MNYQLIVTGMQKPIFDNFQNSWCMVINEKKLFSLD